MTTAHPEKSRVLFIQPTGLPDAYRGSIRPSLGAPLAIVRDAELAEIICKQFYRDNVGSYQLSIVEYSALTILEQLAVDRTLAQIDSVSSRLGCELYGSIDASHVDIAVCRQELLNIETELIPYLDANGSHGVRKALMPERIQQCRKAAEACIPLIDEIVLKRRQEREITNPTDPEARRARREQPATSKVQSDRLLKNLHNEMTALMQLLTLHISTISEWARLARVNTPRIYKASLSGPDGWWLGSRETREIIDEVSYILRLLDDPQRLSKRVPQEDQCSEISADPSPDDPHVEFKPPRTLMIADVAVVLTRKPGPTVDTYIKIGFKHSSLPIRELFAGGRAEVWAEPFAPNAKECRRQVAKVRGTCKRTKELIAEASPQLQISFSLTNGWVRWTLNGEADGGPSD